MIDGMPACGMPAVRQITEKDKPRKKLLLTVNLKVNPIFNLSTPHQIISSNKSPLNITTTTINDFTKNKDFKEQIHHLKFNNRHHHHRFQHNYEYVHIPHTPSSTFHVPCPADVVQHCTFSAASSIQQ